MDRRFRDSDLSERRFEGSLEGAIAATAPCSELPIVHVNVVRFVA